MISRTVAAAVLAGLRVGQNVDLDPARSRLIVLGFEPVNESISPVR